MMKLPNDETQQNHLNGDGYSSDEFDPVEMMPPPVRDNDFSDYLWMENEEEFNSQVLRQLEEEELMEECIAAMIDDSANEESSDSHNADNNFANNSRTASDSFNSSMNSLSENVNILSLSSNGVRNNSSDNVNTSNSQSSQESASRYTAQSRLSRVRDVPPESRPTTNLSAVENGSKSTLNPDAKEFVPTPRSTVASPENEKVSS